MENFYYNSADSRCKTPFGAVREGQDVSFTVFLSPDTAVSEVSLLLFGDDTPAEKYSMEKRKDGCFTVTIRPEKAGLYFYRFIIVTNKELLTAGQKNRQTIVADNADPFQLTVFKKDFEAPTSAKGKIMYQIFPDRFCKGELLKQPVFPQKRTLHENWNELPESSFDKEDYAATDFFGGNLNGIRSKIPYFKELHIDYLYLNPIFESASNHRYNTGDYLSIDPLLGDENDFTTLCEQCKKSGIKLILDGVFSHTGSDSLYFNKEGNYKSIGAFQSKESPYFKWYRFEDCENGYDCWWGFPTLPNVNETEESFLDFITNLESGVLAKWQRLGASGWRLDVADELPDLFLDKLRETVKTLDKEALILGEVWEDASNKKSYGIRRRYLLGQQLDSVMNYPFREAILNFVKDRNAKSFFDSILPILENYPPPSLSCLMNSLSTHDTVRAITELADTGEIPPEQQRGYLLPENRYFLAVERFRLASFLQFTLPGIPCIYYGDEVGLYGFRDPFNRMPYPYGREDLNLLHFFKELTAFHRDYQDDFYADFRPFFVKDGVFSFYRGRLLLCINTSSQKEELTADGKNTLVYGLRSSVTDGKITLEPMSFGAFL